MALSVKIDQAGKPAGVAGQAREDLDTGLPVTLSAVGGPYLSYLWSLRYVGIDHLTSTRSAAALTAATASTTQLTPIDLPDNYAGRLVVDSGAGLGATPDDVFDWTFYAGAPGDPLRGQPSADAAELPRRPIAPGERGEHNVPDALDPAGNVDGWARERARWDELARQLSIRKLYAAGEVTNDGVSATLLRSFGIAGAVRTGLGAVDVTFDAAFEDVDYVAVALPITQGGQGVVTARLKTGCTVERGDPFGSALDGDFVLLVGLRHDPP